MSGVYDLVSIDHMGLVEKAHMGDGTPVEWSSLLEDCSWGIEAQ